MANTLYDKGREAFLGGDISWDTDNIKCALITTSGYTVDLSAHEFYTDLGGIVSTSSNLTNKTITAGVADADDVILAAVTGRSCEVIVLFQDTGNPATSKLIAYINIATGLPVVPNGGAITIQWDNGINKIFKL